MSYNRIATCRAYTDWISKSLASGWITSSQITTVRTDSGTFALDSGNIMDLFDFKPQRYVVVPKEHKEFYIQLDTEVSNDLIGESNFLAIMGHNLHSADALFKVQISDQDDMSGDTETVSDADYSGHDKLINAAADGSANEWIDPADNGWTLFTWTDDTSAGNNRYLRITFREDNDAGTNFDADIHLGAILYGEYFSWPTAAQVDAKVGAEYDGTTIQKAMGGSEYANSTHFGGPMWAYTPWMFNYTSTTNIGVTSGNPYYYDNSIGRRSLALNFNYVADTDLFPENVFSDDTSKNIDSADIRTQFYNRILGRHNPVLFSINESSTDESDYGIYRLQNDLVANQIASRTWNFNLNLREAW
ncbi:MAG: hypothetical protein CMB80_12270 [Flammeovirgaceae bacterium]|nr:hypothetical protein [Flammeovirgaceae bacterium]